MFAIHSTAALTYNAVSTVHHMARLPFRRSQLMELMATSLLPFLPVLALQIPIEDLWAMLKQLL